MTGSNQVKVVVESCNSTGGVSIHTNSGPPNTPTGYTPYTSGNASRSNCPGLNAYNPAPSCRNVLLCNRFLPSGYYWIQTYHPYEQFQLPVRVYCYMKEDKCGVAGVMRVGYLDVTNTTTRCPDPLTLYNVSRRKLCGPTSTVSTNCDSLRYGTMHQGRSCVGQLAVTEPNVIQ